MPDISNFNNAATRPGRTGSVPGRRVWPAAWLAVLVGGSIVASPVPSMADNPKVNLKVTNATPEEAVAQLSKAAGVKLNLSGGRPGGNGMEKVSFDWTNVSFGKALRQLCDQLNFRPYRQASGYMLQPSFQAPPGNPLKKVGLVEKNGVKLFARRAYVYDNRSINFIGEEWGGGSGYLNLELGAELGEGDADLIAGMQNVTARDDQGNIISTDPQRFGSGSSNPNGTYPDEWSGNVMINPPSTKAKKLEWLEADLMVYKSVKPLRLEVPFPLTSKSIRKNIGDMIVVISGFEENKPAAAPEEDPAEADLPNIGQQPVRGQNGGFKLRVRVYTPQVQGRQQRFFARNGWNFAPTLELASGGTAMPNQTNSSGWGNGEWSLSDMTLNYQLPQVPQPPAEAKVAGPTLQGAKLVWDMVERGEMVKLFTFRMTDIPLPQAGLPGQRVRPGAAPPTAPVDRGPHYEKGGGTLVTRIEVAGKPVNGGTLQVGLAQKTGAEFGPVRWSDAAIGPDGTARVEDLKPGAYRVLRRYRPKDPLPDADEGKWANGELTVSVAAGKEAPLPPLRWTLDAASTPVKAVKPGTIKTSVPGR